MALLLGTFDRTLIRVLVALSRVVTSKLGLEVYRIFGLGESRDLFYLSFVVALKILFGNVKIFYICIVDDLTLLDLVNLSRVVTRTKWILLDVALTASDLILSMQVDGVDTKFLMNFSRNMMDYRESLLSKFPF